MGLTSIFSYIIGLFLLIALGTILLWPIKMIFRLIGNGILGGITLLLFNLIGGLFGLNIRISPLNALVVGFLGVPGVIILLVLQIIL